MTENNYEGRVDGPPQLPAGVPGADPRGWVEPKETFPGEVVVSEYRECSEAYMEPNEFRRERLPRPIWQWDLRVLRYDHKWQNADGSAGDHIIYAGYDLERWNANANANAGEIEPINARANKEALIGAAWVATFGSIPNPPTTLVGKKAMFDFYMSKRVGRNVAKRLLLPVAALPPDYVFDGEVRLTISTRTQEGAVAAQSPNGIATSDAIGGQLSDAEAIALLPDLLDGKNAKTIVAAINDFPQNVRTGTVINGLVTGSLIKQLTDEGLIVVAADGTISATAGVTA